MNKTTEKLIQELQDSSDFCRGMSLDPHVDDIAKMACRLRATHIDTIVEEALEEAERATSQAIPAAFPVLADTPMGLDCTDLGMTLRNYFAGMALQGMCANHDWSVVDDVDIGVRAYDRADAMLKERSKGGAV